MKNKLLAIVLVLALAFSLSVPAFAAGFSDLDGHWSKEYMQDLADRGYLSGYGDGTMRPDNDITACESLVLLSRFYNPGTEATALIADDYGDYVAETVPGSLSWAYDELEICLAAGIVTKDELASMDLSAAIEKEQLSVFLVRAMQLESKAESFSRTALTFDDADDISEACVGSVAELVSLKIVTGDDENNFTPKLSVTRAVVATMVSRALDYLETAGTTLVIANYDGVTRTEGIVTSAAAGSLTVRGLDGLMRVYSVAPSSSVTVNGVARSLTSAYTGCDITVTAKDGTVTTAAITSDSAVTWAQGLVGSVFSSTTLRYLYVTDSDSGTTVKYTLSTSAVITLDGKSVSLSAIIQNQFVTMKIENDAVTAITAVSADYEITGEISAITYGTTVSLDVKDTDGTVFCFYLGISDLPAIYRGTTAVTIDRLSVGEAVTVTVKNCDVSSIVTEGSEDTVTGKLISITTTTSGTQWVVGADDGTSSTYTVDVNAGVYSGTTPILLSDIQAGDTVSVVLYGSTITEIYLVTSVSSTTKVSGTVLAVNTSAKTVTILTPANKLVYIDMSSVGSIITASTGKTLTIYSIGVNSELVAYGTYSSSTNFAAKSVVIES